MTTRWSQLLLVQIGGAICLPVLIIGRSLAHCGLKHALISIVLGNLILAALAVCMSFVAIKYKNTTPEIVQRTLGKKAGGIFSLLFLINLIGWFGINLLTMANMVSSRYFFNNPLHVRCIIVGFGILITLSVIGGLQSLEVMAKYLLPFLLWGMLKMTSSETYLALIDHKATNSFDIFGMSLVISGLFTCVLDLPTYFYQAQSQKDGIIASLLLFLVVVPGIEIVGLGIGAPMSANDVPGQLFKDSIGWIGDAFLVFCLLAGWTTNNCNLFSAQTFFQRQSKVEQLSYRQRVVLMGIFGILCGLIGSLFSFEELLIFISTPLIIAGVFLFVLIGKNLILERKYL